jgi:hypothetical protein
MPVSLPLPGNEPRPSPPHPIVWLVVFIVFMLAGVVYTLVTWPASEPTGTAWFWICLLVFPALTWGIVFGLRLHAYDDENIRLDAQDEVREEDRAEAIEFASEPLAVLGYTYLCAMGGANVASRMVGNEAILAAVVPAPGGEAIRHTTLASVVGKDLLDRFRACCFDLLGSMDTVLCSLPRRVPFDVRLRLPPGASQEAMLAIWRDCWRACDLPAAEVTVLEANRGLMILDDWLDIRGGPGLEKFTLVVAVQLHETPPQDSAEAAVALLLGWEPLAHKRGLTSLALFHRPVEISSLEQGDALATALLWGKSEPAQISHLWQTGLDRKDKPTLLRQAAELGVGFSAAVGLAGTYDLDNALGHAGMAAPWLAAALAIEHAQRSGEQQLMTCREDRLQLAVIRPAS